MSDDETEKFVNSLRESAISMQKAAVTAQKIEDNVAKIAAKVLAANPDRIIAAASNSLSESGDNIVRKVDSTIRRVLDAAEATRMEGKAEARRWRMAVVILVAFFAAFSCGFAAALYIRWLGWI